ncbi:MAG: biotin synthase BioB [Desulfoprunum sp.]|nr:biotin synthase BioB [Desulfoprunum sp.]
MIEKYLERITQGGHLEFQEACLLATETPPAVLFQAADQLRRALHHNTFDLCSIINARSGKCSENCKFCAQSSSYDTAIETYELVDSGKAIDQARENEAHGVRRFSLVTAGREVSDRQLARFGDIYKQLRAATGLSLCASMGFLTSEKALRLKEFGVVRYHCNLEASRSFFPQVCSTHSWKEKVETLQIAREAGLELCSGGIIGMGESLIQRLELAFELRELGVLSIPLNILTPIPHTPFAGLAPLSLEEVLTCVAMFRLINPKAVIRMAGGRMLLEAEQYRCFTSGANGAIVGNYLTTAGNTLEEDLRMLQELGFSFDCNRDETNDK